MNLTHAILLISALILVFVLAKLNSAIKLLHNRVNILSANQKSLLRELRAKMELGAESEYEKLDQEMKSRLDRDFTDVTRR